MDELGAHLKIKRKQGDLQWLGDDQALRFLQVLMPSRL